MAFDQSTRTRLQRFVSEARTLLTEECTRQLQHEYGMNPATGEVVELSRLPPLDDTRWETARLLRDTLAHYLATSPSGGRTEALQRIVREQAFTVLNRLVALRMMEARGLLLESIARGYQARGFQLYQRLAGASLGETGDAYRCYLVSLFDEFALDLAVLFDRFSPQGRLFPRESALLALLNLLNHPDIEPLWAEDETIGWIYQYYNTQDERRQMRADSPAPRDSRELAVRNQFFTPRYVVEFLTDNTLGRLWYEMTQGRTALTDQCRYLVRRPQEIFLQPGEEPPAQEEPQNELSQEELLQQPVYIPFRALKDPHEIRMLDPACGSMHFGLYAFNLFEVIYDEAWGIAHGSDEAWKSSASFVSFVSFVVQYPNKAAFLADVPRLIIEYNLHGIDIDPRSVQIAGLSLWLRAQRTWQQQGLRPQDRPRIRRSNIVCAEPMPGEEAFLEEFIEAHLSATPEHKLLGQLVRRVFDAMKLAGEAGSLLKIEEEIGGAVAEAKQKWLADTKPEQGRLFADDIAPSGQKERGLDITGITDETFWEKAEERIYAALQTYAEKAEHGSGYQRRLFADDAARGFAFIDLSRKRYDVVLMNPPFGLSQGEIYAYLNREYPDSFIDLLASFIVRAGTLAPSGLVGAITSRACLYTKTLLDWRTNHMSGRISALADMGIGVLDGAMVRACAYVIPVGLSRVDGCFVDARKAEDKETAILASLDAARNAAPETASFYSCDSAFFELIPQRRILYWLPRDFWQRIRSLPPIEPVAATIRAGLTTYDDVRFLRLRWEVIQPEIGTGSTWMFLSKGGYFGTFYNDVHLVVLWADGGREVGAYNRSLYETDAQSRRGSAFYLRPAATYSRRTDFFSARALPQNCFFADKGPAIIPLGDTTPAYMLGIFNSDLFRGLVHSQSQGGCFETGVLKLLPWSQPTVPEREIVEMSAKAAWGVKASVFAVLETDARFLSPLLSPSPSVAECRSRMVDAVQRANTDVSAKATTISGHVSKLFGLSNDRFEDLDVFETDHEIKEAAELVDNPEAFLTAAVSYICGSAFGRWDIRFATSEKPAPELPDPFAPLPVCPPGQLQNEQGLPITREEVRRLKEEGRWNYPIEIPWDGILVDDPGHPLDFETRVHQVLQVVWKDRWEAIEREACEILGVRTLRDYFRKPADFFADHLKRYSKSRRKAPVYWPLQTPSGSYTLWLYYHRLNDQTLYTCVNDFVEKSKLREVTEQLHVLRTKTSRSKQEENDLERLLDLEQELKDFRDELLRVAQFWKPNLNDGVQITAAPLWKLFQHKPWQKTLQDTWEKLEKGDYDWAHLAYSIWPDRVRDKCRHDKSLAIAHGLEELYEAPPAQPRKKRGRTPG